MRCSTRHARACSGRCAPREVLMRGTLFGSGYRTVTRLTYATGTTRASFAVRARTGLACAGIYGCAPQQEFRTLAYASFDCCAVPRTTHAAIVRSSGAARAAHAEPRRTRSRICVARPTLARRSSPTRSHAALEVLAATATRSCCALRTSNLTAVPPYAPIIMYNLCSPGRGYYQQEVHVPLLNVVQSRRYWPLEQSAAYPPQFPLQSRVKQTLLSAARAPRPVSALAGGADTRTIMMNTLNGMH